jgi:hypothetical protein
MLLPIPAFPPQTVRVGLARVILHYCMVGYTCMVSCVVTCNTYMVGFITVHVCWVYYIPVWYA